MHKNLTERKTAQAWNESRQLEERGGGTAKRGGGEIENNLLFFSLDWGED